MSLFFLSIFSLFLSADYNAYTHITFQDSKICLKSNRQIKCSTDSLTAQQQTALQAKVEALQARVPAHIINDVLNHFWANHHLITSSQVSSLLLNMNSVECTTQNGIYTRRSKELRDQRGRIEIQQRQNDRSLVGACIDEDLSQKVYKDFDFNAIEEALQNQSNH